MQARLEQDSRLASHQVMKHITGTPFDSPLAVLFIPHIASDLRSHAVIHTLCHRHKANVPEHRRVPHQGNRGLHYPHKLTAVGPFLLRVHAVAGQQTLPCCPLVGWRVYELFPTIIKLINFTVVMDFSTAVTLESWLAGGCMHYFQQ